MAKACLPFELKRILYFPKRENSDSFFWQDLTITFCLLWENLDKYSAVPTGTLPCFSVRVERELVSLTASEVLQ